MEEEFKIHSEFKPSGDQPEAIKKLTEGINDGLREQVLLGVTGSGKTFTIPAAVRLLPSQMSYRIFKDRRLSSLTIKP